MLFFILVFQSEISKCFTDEFSIFRSEDSLAIESPKNPNENNSIECTKEWEVNVFSELVEVFLQIVDGAAEMGVESLADGVGSGGEGTG